MKTRNVLFGYAYVGGRIVIQAKESGIVRGMFDAYMGGESLSSIAERLNKAKVEYMPKVYGWNKSRIMRLLEDKRYLGTESYPTLITQNVHDEIQQLRMEKNTQKEVDRQADIFQLEVEITCPNCNGRMRRRHDQRHKITVCWICQNSKCHKIISKEDSELFREIESLMNDVIGNPELVEIPAPQDTTVTLETQELNDEIMKMLKDPKIDQEMAKNKMLGYLSKQYEKIDSTPCQAQKIKDIFTNGNVEGKSRLELLEETAERIRLYEDGEIGIILENRQEIRRVYGES